MHDSDHEGVVRIFVRHSYHSNELFTLITLFMRHNFSYTRVIFIYLFTRHNFSPTRSVTLLHADTTLCVFIGLALYPGPAPLKGYPLFVHNFPKSWTTVYNNDINYRYIHGPFSFPEQ